MARGREGVGHELSGPRNYMPCAACRLLGLHARAQTHWYVHAHVGRPNPKPYIGSTTPRASLGTPLGGVRGQALLMTVARPLLLAAPGTVRGDDNALRRAVLPSRVLLQLPPLLPPLPGGLAPGPSPAGGWGEGGKKVPPKPAGENAWHMLYPCGP